MPSFMSFQSWGSDHKTGWLSCFPARRFLFRGRFACKAKVQQRRRRCICGMINNIFRILDVVCCGNNSNGHRRLRVGKEAGRFFFCLLFGVSEPRRRTHGQSAEGRESKIYSVLTKISRYRQKVNFYVDRQAGWVEISGISPRIPV